MRTTRTVWIVLMLFVIGCSGDDKATKPVVPEDGLPDGTPQADSPGHLVERWEATWEAQNSAEYGKLLTDDFQFHFSPASDPELANEYGNNWTKSLETQTMSRLFNGFTSPGGDHVAGASEMVISNPTPQYVDDFAHADSSGHYRKVVFPPVVLEITVPSSPEPVVYQVSSRQELYLVRSDAAVIAGGSIADPTRWYIRRWDDLAGFSAVAGKGPVINPGSATSIGRIKANYAP